MNYFSRKCPKCSKEITYSNKYNFKNAETKGSYCKSCGLKESITDERIKKMSDRLKGQNNPMYGKKGNLNPFFGRKHTNESKQKMIDNRDMMVYKTESFREKIRGLKIGDKNPMYGRSFYTVWVEKYGKEVANKKMENFKIKQTNNNLGCKNRMFGKPSPIGSGNGWSGWYKGWYFRSIKELTYMIKVIERFNLKWENAETKDLRIPYLDNNNQRRTYVADFLINNKFLVEIKPKNLWKSKSVVLKRESALLFCNNNNLIYKLTDIENLSNKEILNLYRNGEIKFIERYNDRFLSRFNHV